MSTLGVKTLDNDIKWRSSLDMQRLSPGVLTPRPTPQFFQQPQTFSTKKERNTPKDNPPPKPPVKSAPPVSRIFPHKLSTKAQPVSFKKKFIDNSILSPHYDEGRKDLYFDQCFEIESKLGAGSFGEVFKVKSKEDGKFYAVKRSRERFRGESDRKNKLEEVAKHEQLPKHPNCVEFVKAWEERRHLYIQTELCKSSLSDFAENNHTIPETLVWNYLVDLLMAIKHLHNYDLVHMDIKPENIFITEDGVCKLGDFGLVIDLAKGTDVSEAQEGDPKYLAPELMAGVFDKPADLFSVGITILELASDLDLPRGGQLWHQLRSGQLPDDFLVGISEDLKHIIHWMMEPDTQKRPTPSEVLHHPILKTVWKRRQRAQLVKKVVDAFHWIEGFTLGILMTLWLTILYPVNYLYPKHVNTPEKDISHKNFHPPEWDHSFSDDDTHDDSSISLSNNSMGNPLDLSTSSDGSLLNEGYFAVPSSIPKRKVQTTPGMRNRFPFRRFTPQSSSPVLASSGSHYSSSPLASPQPIHFPSDDSITPNSSFHERVLTEVEPLKMGIEPKNLMEAFEGASSDED